MATQPDNPAEGQPHAQQRHSQPTEAPRAWEYRVVHINVEPGHPPQAPNPQVASDHLHGTLSPDFLAREFPEVYGDESEASRRSRHPAEQLQTFLNLLGRQGWEMTDSCQVGPLLMFFFKRPMRPLPKLLASARSRPAVQHGEQASPSEQSS
jgi:hypothetical protein